MTMVSWSCRVCIGKLALSAAALLALAGAPAGATEPQAPTPKPGSVLEALLAKSDAAACDQSPEQAAERRQRLLDHLKYSTHCFVANPTDAQLNEILARYDALPPGGFVGGRYFMDGTVWAGPSGQGPSGQALRTTLRYSFPNDGIAWGSGFGGSNNLNTRFTTQFGAANRDRGRELVRQALASWRRTSSLNYTEVADDNSAMNNATFVSGTGDIRIGAIPQGNTGVLAYNFFPSGGADMTINSDELTGGSLFNATNSYRYFRNVVAHEHGHGLGFIHSTPCNTTKLMEPFASANFDTVQIDEIRGAHRSYGDRFAGNNSAATAKDFGNLTSPAVRSVIEKLLSTNGSAGPNGTNADWFKFTLGSTQNVVITVAPQGGTYANGQQSSGCNPTNPGSINASQAGNLNLELRDAAGNTVLQSASSAAAGSNEVLTLNNLAAGTYTARVVDVGPNVAQTVQLYDLTVRVGTSKAPPLVIAGLSKRVPTASTCFFMGDVNSRVNEAGATLNSASYDWDLNGDGTFETLDTPQPTFTYNSNGIYNVTLRVTDSNGISATDTIVVTATGATSTLTNCLPNQGGLGTTVPVTLTGTNLAGVTSSSQVTVSGTGVTVSGTPVVNGAGTTVTGLSFNVAMAASISTRTIAINNADGTGQVATGANLFTVVNTPPPNDTCAAPISWGSITGARPFSNVNATTGTPQSFPSTGCPAAGPINNDVWYTWVAPTNGNLNITTDSASQPVPFSSRVAVYQGTTCPPAGANLRGCEDFGLSFNISVSSGATYLFQVGSVLGGVSGNANVILTFTPSLGACCASDATCSITPTDGCLGTSTFLGIGTSCDPIPCEEPQGTCCAPDGACTILYQSECTVGTFAGGGVCSPNPCPQPFGSCCLIDGTCIEVEQAACSGVWTIAGVCEPSPCAPPTGSCCITDGSCSVTAEAACTGVWTAAGICSPNPCTQPTGSCCITDGSCTVTTQAACTGAWTLAGICSPNPCSQPTGACCNATTCSIATSAACTGVFQGVGSACGAVGNPTTCCPANFNQASGITVQDIFDFLGAYFAGTPNADFNGAGGITVQDIFDFLSAYFAGCPA